MESLSNSGLHSSLSETPDSGERARYWLPNNTLKRHSHARVRQMFAALKRMVFGPFWSEKGYNLYFGMVFETTTGAYERSYRFNSK